jgi:hypothetical protein
MKFYAIVGHNQSMYARSCLLITMPTNPKKVYVSSVSVTSNCEDPIALAWPWLSKSLLLCPAVLAQKYRREKMSNCLCPALNDRTRPLTKTETDFKGLHHDA